MWNHASGSAEQTGPTMVPIKSHLIRHDAPTAAPRGCVQEPLTDEGANGFGAFPDDLPNLEGRVETGFRFAGLAATTTAPFRSRIGKTRFCGEVVWLVELSVVHTPNPAVSTKACVIHVRIRSGTTSFHQVPAPEKNTTFICSIHATNSRAASRQRDTIPLISRFVQDQKNLQQRTRPKIKFLEKLVYEWSIEFINHL